MDRIPAARVGIDLVEIARMERCMQNPRFVTRVFGVSERLLFTGARRFARAAANFAAKEAFAKALGTGIRGFSLSEVEVLRDDLGAPYLQLSGQARAIAERMGFGFSVSLSHERGYAAAVVLAQPLSSDPAPNSESKGC